MEFLTKLVEVINGIDIIPGLVGAFAGLYVQGDEYSKLSYGRAVVLFISSLAVAHFIGCYLVTRWDLDVNGSNAVKFLIAAYTPDIMQAADKVVNYYKENPMGIFKKRLNDEKN